MHVFAPLRYYSRVLVMALKGLRETHEWLISWGTLLGLSLPAWLSGRIDKSLPTWPWWVSVALWLSFILLRANWREVCEKNAQIRALRRASNTTYENLCNVTEKLGLLLARAPFDLVSPAPRQVAWMNEYQDVMNYLFADVAQNLLRSERDRLTVLNMEGEPPRWVTENLVTPEHFSAYRKGKATWEALRLLCAKYEPSIESKTQP